MTSPRRSSRLVVVALLLAACSSDSDEVLVTTVGGDLPSTTAAAIPPTGDGSSRDDPIPVGAVTEVGDWRLRVASVMPMADDVVMAENEFNEPPGGHEQFFLVTLEATYMGDESGSLWIDLSLAPVGASNVAYRGFESSCGIIPDPIVDIGETFPGGTVRGNACWKIRTVDSGTLVLIAEETFDLSGRRTFLSLDPAAAPLEASTAAESSEPVAIDTVPVGAVVDLGVWRVRVVSVTPVADDIVLAENLFNEPPEPGRRFFMVGLEATYTGDASSTFWFDVSLKPVGRSKVAYEDFESLCGVIPDAIDQAGETFPGGTISGNACWEIDDADAESLVLIAEDALGFSSDRVFLSLDAAATPLDETTATDHTPTPLQAEIPLGEATETGDWLVRITSVTPFADDLVLAENPFNEPPGPGEQFFMVGLEATYVGDESSTFWFHVDLKLLGDRAVAYENYVTSCGVIPDPIDDAGEVFPGGTITGNACWKVSSDEVDSLIMIVDDVLTFSGDRALLSLR